MNTNMVFVIVFVAALFGVMGYCFGYNDGRNR